MAKRTRPARPDRPSGRPPRGSVAADMQPAVPAMLPHAAAGSLAPEARRREVARLLAAAAVRLQTRRGARPTACRELSESSPRALESPRRSATHVTVREDVDAQPEDRA